MELLSGDLDDLTKVSYSWEYSLCSCELNKFESAKWTHDLIICLYCITQSDIFSLGATLYEICLSRPQNLPENGQEWQDIRQGNLLPMPNTPFDMSMIIREMMAPEWRTRPSAEDLLKKRQLLSDEQMQLIVERNKANAANTALDAQMVRLWSGFLCYFSVFEIISIVMNLILISYYFTRRHHSNVSNYCHQRMHSQNSVVAIPYAEETMICQ